MNETTAIVIWVVAMIALIAIVARWFMHDGCSDYIEGEDYTLRDFYTRKHK